MQLRTPTSCARACWCSPVQSDRSSPRAPTRPTCTTVRSCACRGLTGLPCPGCGLTRAACALSHGDIVGALEWNALSVPIAFAILAASLIATAELARGSAWQFYRRLYAWLLIRVCLITTLGYHIGRCVYGVATGSLLQ